MPSQPLIDISGLLEPISADNAVGNDVRLVISPTSDYSLIRDARRSARSAERSTIFDGISNAAEDHWRIVSDLAPKILKTQSKDLEVACWYTEALVRKAGFRGARDGFTLIRRLIENFWDDLYPSPDSDGVATRVAALTGLNGEGAEGVLIAPLRSIPITEGGDPGPFSYWQYKQALDAQRLTDEQARNELIAKNGFNIADIQNAVVQSSQAFYIDLRDDVSDALKEYKAISQKLDEHCGVHDSPPTSNIINTLTDVLGAITHIARDKLPQPTDDAQVTMEGNTGTAPAATISSGPVKSRDDAFRQLSQISQFFRQTEPHSPISYVIEKAVKWGNMSLAELTRELIPDSGSRDTYSSLTGVKNNEE